ncbi:MAG TPA: hypothetical protein VFR41_10560, partial [Acidimicrobiia bacterium]|nr:hypothetical protein [Acidimicrobiia bacterium]
TDWSQVRDDRARRVGVVHAVGNTAVLSCYFLSWRARRHQHGLRGRAWAFAGGTLAWGTGYLGRHLLLARGVGQGQRGMNLGSSDDQLVDITEAAELLGVPTEQVHTMIAEDVIVVVPGEQGSARLRRDEVEAVRLLGG